VQLGNLLQVSRAIWKICCQCLMQFLKEKSSAGGQGAGGQKKGGPPHPRISSAMLLAKKNGVLAAASSTCRSPRLSGSANCRQPEAVPAMQNRRAAADTTIPAARSAAIRQPMTPPCRNPQPRQRCPSGRAHSTYVPCHSEGSGAPLSRPNSPSSPLPRSAYSAPCLAKYPWPPIS
jgi:hypothetical protein